MVTQKDQVVTGDTAIFDTRANLITMAGGVVLTQCKNVLKGDRLKVDMTTGVSRVESDGGKVQGMFIQGENCGSGSGGAKHGSGSGTDTVADPRQKIIWIDAGALTADGAVLLAQFCGSGACADRFGDALAQGAMSGVPNAMQGFSQNRDQPIQIEAASLEMRDKKKEATFAGNVKVVQGDTTMTSKSLVVFYDSGPAPATPRPPRRRDRNPGRCSPRRRGPAAVRRSAGWKPRAPSWSHKRTRS